MRAGSLGEKENPDLAGQAEIKDVDHSKARESTNYDEGRLEDNLRAKAAMVFELVEMGMSLEAIERILNLKPEALDQLL